jgi:hypothetical protein
VVQNRYVPRLALYLHCLTDKYTTTYIRWLIDEGTGIFLSVEDTFLSSDTEEYIIVIFLGTEEYKTTKECTLFSCSVMGLVYR